MSEPYLILHKVRGESAFDIAIKLDHPIDDDGPIWLIPTSGHRAYPFQWHKLYSVSLEQFLSAPTDIIPSDWPDHYSCNDRSAKLDLYEVKAKARGLLETLNLVKKVEVERRF